MKARAKTTKAAPSTAPTAAGIIVSLLGGNDLTFQHLLPLAERELATVFPLDGFDVGDISSAAERMALAIDRRFPGADEDDASTGGLPHRHAEAGFVLGLVSGLRIAGAK